jgi:hypothetical protein
MSPYTEAFFLYSFSGGNFPVGLLCALVVLPRVSGSSCLMRTGYSNNGSVVGTNVISLFNVSRDKQYMCVSWLGLVSSIFTFFLLPFC